MYQKTILALRIALGGLFFYDGLSKILTKTWTAAPELLEAATLPHFFAWFADPSRINIVNFLNEWGLLIIGVALLIGFRVRLASIFGMILMVLYYLLNLVFPIASGTGFLIDRHIIYFFVFLLLFIADAGHFWGLDGKLVIRIED